GRESLVRRVSITSGVERQNLPELLPGSNQEINKFIGSRTEISDAIRPGQRRYVQKNSAATGKFHLVKADPECVMNSVNWLQSRSWCASGEHEKPAFRAATVRLPVPAVLGGTTSAQFPAAKDSQSPANSCRDGESSSSGPAHSGGIVTA